jgi:hypothetical protein
MLPRVEAKNLNDCRSFCAVLLAGVWALTSPATAESTGGWRLLRSANPHGAGEAVAMSHAADIVRSDLDLAGMMLRCPDGAAAQPAPAAGADVVIVVVTPLSPRAQPNVTIVAGGTQWHFAARVVPPGAELQLPAEATELAAGPWQSTHELAVTVSLPERSFGGVIPIDGLADALVTLAANCPAG